MSSNPTPQQLRALELATKKAQLEALNKERARAHLIQMQAVLVRTIPMRDTSR